MGTCDKGLRRRSGSRRIDPGTISPPNRCLKDLAISKPSKHQLRNSHSPWRRDRRCAECRASPASRLHPKPPSGAAIWATNRNSFCPRGAFVFRTGRRMLCGSSDITAWQPRPHQNDEAAISPKPENKKQNPSVTANPSAQSTAIAISSGFVSTATMRSQAVSVRASRGSVGSIRIRRSRPKDECIGASTLPPSPTRIATVIWRRRSFLAVGNVGAFAADICAAGHSKSIVFTTLFEPARRAAQAL